MSRKRFITHPHYQFAFLFAYVKGILISLLPATVIFNLTLGLVLFLPGLNEAQRIVLETRFHRLVVMSLLVMLIAAIVVGILGFLLSNRYAGPLRRAQTWCHMTLRQHDAGALVMRKNDDLYQVMEILKRYLKARSS